MRFVLAVCASVVLLGGFLVCPQSVQDRVAQTLQPSDAAIQQADALFRTVSRLLESGPDGLDPEAV